MSFRLNKFIAQSTGLSRRAADKEIEKGNVTVNGLPGKLGDTVTVQDNVIFNGKRLELKSEYTSIAMNKPRGYVSSRNGQGSPTVYELLPQELHNLKIVGRLDKDSSGLLLLTDDGNLANELAHPKHQKLKQYEITLDRPLKSADFTRINDDGVKLDDGVSRLGLDQADEQGSKFIVTMREGRNRQIRRTFAALGYTVRFLHRFRIGDVELGSLKEGQYRKIDI